MTEETETPPVASVNILWKGGSELDSISKNIADLNGSLTRNITEAIGIMREGFNAIVKELTDINTRLSDIEAKATPETVAAQRHEALLAAITGKLTEHPAAESPKKG